MAAHSAPPLAPLEQAEVDRFGVHDEDVLRDLAEHADDVIPCGWCRKTATWRMSMRCCGEAEMACQKHRDAIRDRFAGHDPRARPRCMHCGHRHPVGASYADVVREVPM